MSLMLLAFQDLSSLRNFQSLPLEGEYGDYLELHNTHLLTPWSLVLQSPHLGTLPGFLVYRYTNFPPIISKGYKLFFDVAVVFGNKRNNQLQFKIAAA